MSFAGLSDEDRAGLNTTQATQNGFNCGAGSYCGNQMGTLVGTGSAAATIFHRTKTTITNGKATTEVYILSDGKWINAAKTTDGGKTYTFSEATRPDGSKIVGPGLRQSLGPGGNMNKNVKAQVTNTLKEGGVSLTKEPQLTDQQIKQTGAVDSNAGIGTTTASSEGASDIQEELKQGYKEGTRKDEEYTKDIKYPLTLRLENQDCIKFSIIKYKAPGLKSGSPDKPSRIIKLVGNKPGIENRKTIATITLPIPAGISDRNFVDWQGNPLDEIQQAFADISLSTILGGGEAGVEATKGQTSNVAPNGDTGGLKTTIASKLTEAAVGTSNIMAREFGAVANANLELLFNGPQLRTFTFTFRFTPRQQEEAEAVKKIIRHFKQAMSVKRSKSSLLLLAPHTFAISYLSNNKDHPYLNKFKECALTDCAVNYTPDGTYMTYADSSMTAYELQLTFQELEPIFDDDYFEIDQNKDTSIGF